MEQFVKSLTFTAEPPPSSAGSGSVPDPLVPSDGTQNLTGNLAVSGNGTFGGTLGVTGATSLAATTVSTTLGVTGAVTLSSTLGVTGAITGTSASLSTTLGVTGATTLSSTLAVTGATTLSAALTGTTGTLATADAGTTSVTTQLTLQHTSSGTPAAGFGVGLAFALHDAGNNLETGATFDARWVDATAASGEETALVGRTMISGALTDVLKIAAIPAGAASITSVGATAPDCDGAMVVNRCFIGSIATDNAYFTHRDQTGSTSAHFRIVGGTGAAIVNCLSGATTELRHNNVAVVSCGNATLGFYGTTPASKQSISGSRGGNAALADLLTKLATIGLITDGTSA